MDLIELTLSGNLLEPLKTPPIIGNSKGVYAVMVHLNRVWKAMDIKAVFKCGKISVESDPEFGLSPDTVKYFFIPDEVLRMPGKTLSFGMVGTLKNVVLPTQMITLGNVIEGARLSVELNPAPEPEPELPEV